MSLPVIRRGAVVGALYLFIAVTFLELELLRPDTVTAVPATGDLLGNYYPTLRYGFAQLRSGSIPFWDPYQACGHPFIAALHQGFFYPLYLPFLVLPAAQALNAHIVVHLVLAAAGAHALARHLGLGRAPAVLAGVVYGFHGSMTNKVFFPDFLTSAAWIPWLVLLVDVVLVRPSPRAAAALAAVIGLAFLGGHGPQFMYLTGWALVPLLAVRAVQAARRGGLRRAAAGISLLAAAGVLGVLLALVRVVPTAEFVRESWRPPGRLEPAAAAMMSVPAGILVQGALTPAPGPRAVPWLADALLAAYAGVVPLALAVAGGILWDRRTVAAAFAVSGVGAVLYALGPVTPVFRLLYALPAGGWFRGPDRALVLAGLAVSILAAAGLHEIVRRGARQGGRGRAAVVVGASFVALLVLSLTAGAARGHTRAVVYLGLGLAVVTLVLRGAWRRTALAALGALVVADLFLAQHHLGRLPSEFDYAAGYEAHFREIRARQGYDRTYMWNAMNAFEPDRPLYFFSHLAKAGLNHGIWMATDYEPLCGRRLARYLAELGPPPPAPLGPVCYQPFTLTAENMPLAELLGLRFFMLPDGGRDALLPHAGALADRWSLLMSDQGVSLFEYRGPVVPRAFVAPAIEVESDDERVLARLKRVDPRTVAFVDRPPSDPLPAPGGATAAGRARIVAYAPERVTIETDVPAGGLLVLTDQYDAGWQAAVDGVATPVYRTDVLFRGVVLPPGARRVDFVYRPASFTRGAAGTLVGLVLTGALAAAGGRRTWRV